MKLPDRRSKGFNKKEMVLLKHWEKELKSTKEGERILENIDKEYKVPDNLWKKFLGNLVHRLKEGDESLDAVRNAIDDDMMLQGPVVNREQIPESFSKLLKARSLFRYKSDNIPIYMLEVIHPTEDKEGEEKLCKWIDDRSLTIKNGFKNIKLQGKRPIVWATFSDEIQKLRLIHDCVNDLCDRLGLLDFEKCDYVLELRYESKKVENVRYPTVIEGGENPAFQPCEDGDECGYTLDLKSGDWGLPEIVHEPIDFHEIESLHYIGHKDKNPEPFWEIGNKSISEES